MKSLKIIISIVMIVLTALGWFSYATGGSKEYIEYKNNLAAAEEFTEKGLYDRAIDAYLNALEYKSSEKVWEQLIDVCQLNIADYPDMEYEYIEYEEKALTYYPKNEKILKMAATSYCNYSEYEKAYKLLTKAIEHGVYSEEITNLTRKVKFAYSIKGRNIYDFHGPNGENYSAFNGGSWGTIDTTGQVIDSFEYIYCGPVNKDGVRLINSENHGSRLYDGENKVLAKFDFDVTNAGLFSENIIAILVENNTYTFFDEFGNELFGGFQDASNFYNGLAAVKQNDKWGIINNSGEFVVQPKMDDIVLDQHGYFNAQEVVVAAENGKYGFYNEKLSKSNDFTADEIGIITNDGICAYKDGSKWGFVKSSGDILIEPSYDNAKSFSNGLAAVCQKNKWGFIDTENNIAIGCEFSDADYFNAEGSCFISQGAADDGTVIWNMIVLELGI